MDFNSTGQWLLCVTGDSTLIMIPVYFLMQHRVPLPNTQSEPATTTPPPATTSTSSTSPFSSLFSRSGVDADTGAENSPKKGFPSLMKLGDKPAAPPPQRQAFIPFYPFATYAAADFFMHLFAGCLRLFLH